MNSDQPSRENIEARITALLLDELPADEAQLLRYTISQDAALKKLHDELSYKEIAARTGLTTSNVGFILHTALKTIAIELAKTGVVP